MKEIYELREQLKNALKRIEALEEKIKVLDGLHFCSRCGTVLVEGNHVIESLCTACEVDLG